MKVISGLNIIMKNGQSGNSYWISSNTKTWFSEIGKILEELKSKDQILHQFSLKL